MAILLETLFILMLMLAVVALIFAMVHVVLSYDDYDLEEIVNG